MQRKALREASCESISKLTQVIKDFTTAYNKNVSLFGWRKREVKGAQLCNTIINLCN
ncbi:hypothetical protein NTG1052_360027 [Candidatus Nitrotoga sp. 1052]|nr:hypothetical protein NTG1052_360027 [Candidatus Nitrotoga sp. 1052]